VTSAPSTPRTSVGTTLKTRDTFGAVALDGFTHSKAKPTGVHLQDGKPVFVVPLTDYDGLVDTMFHMTRQSAEANTAVLISQLDVREVRARRNPRATRQRHADLVLGDGERDVSAPGDLDDIRRRYTIFRQMK
jgi:hypothetical protein